MTTTIECPIPFETDVEKPKVELPKGFQRELTELVNKHGCDHDLKNTMTVLLKHDLNVFQCYPILTHFENNNGFCDCEVLMNYPFSEDDQ